MASIDSPTFSSVRAAVLAKQLRVSIHAVREAEADRLTLHQIEALTCSGDCVEDYPTDPRGPSCLVLGRGLSAKESR